MTPPTICSQGPSPGGLVFNFWLKSPHPCMRVDPHLLALKPRPTPPQIGSLYPIERPPVIRSQKPSLGRSVFDFWPNSLHPCMRVNPHLLALKTQSTPPQIGSLYPIKRPPTIHSQKLSPGGSVFGFWPKSPHPHALVDLCLPALRPQLTPPKIGLPYRLITPPMLNSRKLGLYGSVFCVPFIFGQ